MGGQLATGSSIYMASAGVPAADGAGLSSIKSFSQLLTSIAAMPLAGGTFIGHVLFTDNTYDIGASGATRPRTVYAGTSVITPLLNNSNAAALTLGNSTYGVTVPGAATFSGDISMSKTSAQGYINAYSPNGSKYLSMWATNADNAYMHSNTATMYLQSSSSAINLGTDLWLQTPANGSAYVFRSGVNSTFDVYNSGSPSYKYTRLTHDGTNGILSTSSGRLILSGATYTQCSPANGITLFATTGVQSSLEIYDSANTRNIAITHNGTNGVITTTSGAIQLSPNSGTVSMPAVSATNISGQQVILYRAGSAATLQTYGVGGVKYGELKHDDTNAVLSTSSGNLNLVPTGGTVAVTGAVTASGTVTVGTYTVATLPAAGSNAYSNANVSDSNAAASGNYGATVAGGGSNKVRVFSDGTNWVIA